MQTLSKSTQKFLFPALILLGALFSVVPAIVSSNKALAASAAGFNAGNIMDDFVFTNKNTMNPDQIQVFFNSKVSACDTWGAQPSEYGGGTRAQWGTARGTPPPFTCIKDFYENGRSAAQIIHDTAQEFTINPQVLIVLLQKEQGLITDTWPTSNQYRTATGYGCPDSSPGVCNSNYYGFTNQVRKAAQMFRAILNNSPTWYTPYVLGNNYIRYNPNASCGGSVVNIENRTTQALYNYTPYQPNQGALNAGYGTAPCGAYGNRNFYLYFIDWFGTVRANDTMSPHPDGTVVNINNAAYLIEGGTLHHIINAAVFESNNFRWNEVKPGTTGDKNLTVSWKLNFIQPGTLYSDGTSVYTTIYENNEWVKQHISYASFVSLGYQWTHVRSVQSHEMPQKTSNTILTSSRHPDGTLISTPQGVYYIDHGTKRYVSPPVFLSQRWDWNKVYKETNEDRQIPTGANMLLKRGAVISDSTNLYIVNLPASGPEIKRPIGPWTCFANAMHYTMDDVTYMTHTGIPSTTGPNVTCQ